VFVFCRVTHFWSFCVWLSVFIYSCIHFLQAVMAAAEEAEEQSSSGDQEEEEEEEEENTGEEEDGAPGSSTTEWDQTAMARSMSYALSPAVSMAELGTSMQLWLQQPASVQRKPVMMVLTPSRELAAQVGMELYSLLVRTSCHVTSRHATSRHSIDRSCPLVGPSVALFRLDNRPCHEEIR
jgi:hypothetical protein